MDSWARFTMTTAGMMGMAGVVTAAAGTHVGGGELARVAAEFLLIHAVMVLVLAGLVTLGMASGRLWLSAASILAVGTIIFSGDLAFIAFRDWRPVPMAAPIGGSMMILGWLIVTIGAGIRAKRVTKFKPVRTD